MTSIWRHFDVNYCWRHQNWLYFQSHVTFEPKFLGTLLDPHFFRFLIVFHFLSVKKCLHCINYAYVSILLPPKWQKMDCDVISSDVISYTWNFQEMLFLVIFWFCPNLKSFWTIFQKIWQFQFFHFCIGKYGKDTPTFMTIISTSPEILLQIIQNTTIIFKTKFGSHINLMGTFGAH